MKPFALEPANHVADQPAPDPVWFHHHKRGLDWHESDPIESRVASRESRQPLTEQAPCVVEVAPSPPFGRYSPQKGEKQAEKRKGHFDTIRCRTMAKHDTSGGRLVTRDS